jgi:voltage-gated potassium channel Kch
LGPSADPAELAAADHHARWVDIGLSALLLLQGVTLFLVIPLNTGTMAGRAALDACHLGYALICVFILTRHRGVRIALLAGLGLLVGGPALAGRLGAELVIGSAGQHELIAGIAFAFNAGVTALVARHVFGGGRVTAHRIRGAILLYLNVAALFAILYGIIALNVAGAFAFPHGQPLSSAPGTAIFSYFSLATITTTGYGDIVPLAPMARSLANFEAVFGQLFPATLLSRLVALHLAHEQGPT